MTSTNNDSERLGALAGTSKEILTLKAEIFVKQLERFLSDPQSKLRQLLMQAAYAGYRSAKILPADYDNYILPQQYQETSSWIQKGFYYYFGSSASGYIRAQEIFNSPLLFSSVSYILKCKYPYLKKQKKVKGFQEHWQICLCPRDRCFYISF